MHAKWSSSRGRHTVSESRSCTTTMHTHVRCRLLSLTSSSWSSSLFNVESLPRCTPSEEHMRDCVEACTDTGHKTMHISRSWFQYFNRRQTAELRVKLVGINETKWREWVSFLTWTWRSRRRVSMLLQFFHELQDTTRIVQVHYHNNITSGGR